MDIFSKYNIDKNNYYSAGWGLSEYQLNLIGNLIVTENINNIIEFGTGYSTKFIFDLLKAINRNDIFIESYENSEKFQITTDYESCILNLRHLVECSDESYEYMFKNKIINKSLFSPRILPPSTTNQKNCFYDINENDIALNNYDLLILDGPNGNGRNFAFLYLQNKLKKNSYIFIDDFDHYDFVEKCSYFFNTSEIDRYIKDKRHVLLKIV